MLLKILLGVLIGGGLGFALNRISLMSGGGSCPITCNPYVSVIFGIAVGVLFAIGR
ncbi:MAG: DUF6132 family protein [Chloroflexi bacterium]|nr:DUF6132 family protein [Chloroflexota bacterium]